MNYDIQTPLDVQAIREDFPILHQEHHPGVPLVYLDSAATSQKPRQVIDAMSDYYLRYNANVHRAGHKLANEATEAYELARLRLAKYLNAPDAREVIWTRNATESINLVAMSWGRANLKPGDVVITTQMEHHANIVPWQVVAEMTGAEVKYVPITKEGEFDFAAYEALLDERVKFVSVVHMSNVVGTLQPVEEIVKAAKKVGALTLIDGAQSAAHMRIDVQAIGCDFFAVSAHKMLGPTGIGALWGRAELLEAMPPYMLGGNMIAEVKLTGTTFNTLPYKFEAGTHAIAETVGFGAALDYLEKVGIEKIHQHEHALTEYALERIAEIGGVQVMGPQDSNKRGGLAAMYVPGIHAMDIAELLDSYGVAVRAGHHCAMPLHQCYGVGSSARASFYLYNTFEEIDRLAEAMLKVKRILGF